MTGKLEHSGKLTDVRSLSIPTLVLYLFVSDFIFNLRAHHSYCIVLQERHTNGTTLQERQLDSRTGPTFLKLVHALALLSKVFFKIISEYPGLGTADMKKEVFPTKS